MSSPASSKSGSAATSPAGAGGAIGPTVTPTAATAAAAAVQKEESSFSRWKKKFSKPKRSEITATPAAISLLNVAAVHRAAHQRAAMRALRRWKAAIDAAREAQQAKAIQAAVQASGGGRGRGLSTAERPSAIFTPSSDAAAAGTSGIGLGLALYGSPLQRPRMPSNAGSSLSPPPLSGYASNLDPPGSSSSMPQPPSPLSPFLGARSPLNAAGIKASPPRNRAVTFGGLEEEDGAEHNTFGTATGTVPISSSAGGGHARGNSMAIPHAQQGLASTEGQGLDAPSAVSFSSSPLSAMMVVSPPSSSLPKSTGSMVPQKRPSVHKVQSMTMAAPKRTLSPKLNETDAELATARARAAVLANSPWTSARPVRPSIIRADSRRSIMQPAPGTRGVLGLGGGTADTSGGINDVAASLSPAMAFKRSLRARDSVILTARAASGSSSTGSPSKDATTPLSPSRDINAADGAPPPTPPHGMDAHPRGAVMLGDTKEWTEKDAQAAAAAAAAATTSARDTSVPPTSPKNKGVRFDASTAVPAPDASAVAPIAAVSDPSLSPAARRDLIRLRWKGAIKQIMSLSMWARRRSGSRLSVSGIGPTAAAAAAAASLKVHSGSESETSESDDDDDDRTTIDPALLAMGAKPVPPKSTASVAGTTAAADSAAIPPPTAAAEPEGPSLTPKNTLLDYFLLFGLGSSALSSLETELKSLSTTGTGLTSRKHLESLISETNHQLSAANHGAGAQPELLMRFPQRDRRHFPLDPAWGVFGFPENVAVSLTPRVTQLYSSVMTLADGMALFATYLKFDQPLLPNLPHAFCPEPNGGASHSGSNGGSNGATMASPTPQGKFAFPPMDSPSPPAVASTPGVTVTPGSSHSASSPPSLSSHTLPLYFPQVYVPRCMVLVSHYPQLDVLRQIASQLFEVACSPGAISSVTGVSLEAYLVALAFEIPLPIPRKYAVRFRIHRALCTTIFPGVRSTVHSALNLELLFRTLNVDNSIGVLAAMLTESRILFHSTSMNLLSHVMLGFLQIFFPFQWWYSFVPLLTEAMLDAHEIPQPYMLGVHSKHLPLLHALDEVLIVDLDHDVLRCSVVLTPLPIKDGRELWMHWRRSYERIAIQKIDQSADCRVEQMERWSKQHNAFPAPSNGLPPLHGSAAASPHPVPHPSPATSPAQQLSSQVTMSTLQGHARRSSFITAGNSVPSTPGGLLASPVAPPGLGPSSSTAASPAGAVAWGGPSSHVQHQMHHSGATPIASPFPATAFNLDEEVYAALLRFYSDLLSGYPKFLFFISDVPFFNAQGFLSARVAKDPAALGFFQRFVASRAFDVFIEEESSPDAYHEFLAAGTPLNRIQSILMQDFGTCERVLSIPDPAPATPQQIAAATAAVAGAASTNGVASEPAKPLQSTKRPSHRVEVESHETRDEVIQAVQLLDPQDRTTLIAPAARGSATAAVNAAIAAAAALSPSLHFPVSGTPFAQPLRSDLIADATQAHELVTAKGAPAPPAPSALAPPLRSFHWEGLEADLLHFNFSLLQPTPRKPKSLAPEENEDGSAGSTAAAAAALAASANNVPASAAAHGGIPPPSSMVRAPSAPSMHESQQSSDSLAAPKKKLLPSYSSGHLDTSSAAHQDHRVKQLLSQIFSSHTLSKDEMKEFRALMQNAPNCRRLFATILAQPKHHAHGSSAAGTGHAGSSGGGSSGGSTGGGSSSGSTSLCLTPIGFEQLSSLVLALLDASYSAHDYLSALGALESATVYYWEQPGGASSGSGSSGGGGGSSRNHGPSRVYLESAMKSHKIWQQLDFWRAGLAHALSSRAIKQGHRTASAPSTPSAAAAAAAPPVSPTAPPSASGSSSASDNEFLLQWLISAAHQMLSNQVPFARVDSLIKELSHTHHLSADGLSTITAFLAKTKEAMQFWNA